MVKKITIGLLFGLCVFIVGCAGGIVKVNQDQPNPVFRVTVDYDKSLKEMIAAGKYDSWADDDFHFTEERYLKNGRGKVEVDLELVQFKKGYFSRPVEFRSVIKALERNGFRPATLPELLALGEQYPNLQLEYVIVALGSIYMGDQVEEIEGVKTRWCEVPCLALYNNEALTKNDRILDPHDWWDPEYPWARFHKKYGDPLGYFGLSSQRKDIGADPKCRFAAVRVRK